MMFYFCYLKGDGFLGLGLSFFWVDFFEMDIVEIDFFFEMLGD